MSSPEFQARLQEAKDYRSAAVTALQGAGKPKEYIRTLRKAPEYQEAGQLVLFYRWEKLGVKPSLPEFTQEEWEETGQILSGMNNGVKAALYLSIAQNTQPDSYMPIEDIVDNFKTLFADTQFLEAFSKYRGNVKGYVIDYCRNSLCNVGLLTEQYALDYWGTEKLVGFGLKEERREVGISSALSVLWMENTIHESLYPILGATNSAGETRAPFNVTRILDYLIRHPVEIRDADLKKDLSLTNGIPAENCQLLSRAGLIDYRVINYSRGEAPEYETQGDQDLRTADHVNQYPLLQDQIVNGISTLAQGATFSIGDIYQGLPDKIKGRGREDSLKKNIGVVLNSLVGQGFLKRVSGYKGTEKLSDISPTRNGREFYFRFIFPILSIVSGRALTESQEARLEKARENFVAYAKNSAEFYYPYSRSSKLRQSAADKVGVLGLLSESQVPLTTRDLAEKLGCRIRLVSRYLRPQIEGSNEITITAQGQTFKILREYNKRRWYFSLKSA